MSHRLALWNGGAIGSLQEQREWEMLGANIAKQSKQTISGAVSGISFGRKRVSRARVHAFKPRLYSALWNPTLTLPSA